MLVLKSTLEKALIRNRQLEEEVEILTIKQFREGDYVYIDDDRKTNVEKVYLRESYNGGTCYYFSKNASGNYSTNSATNGVNIKRLTFEKPVKCNCCSQIIR